MFLNPIFNKTGKDLITAAAVGYEIGTRLCDSTSLRAKGYDHVNFTEIAMAAALSKLLDFNENQIINAISIALVPHVALRQPRVGDLTMWKAGAAANSARNSVFGALATLYGINSTTNISSHVELHTADPADIYSSSTTGQPGLLFKGNFTFTAIIAVNKKFLVLKNPV